MKSLNGTSGRMFIWILNYGVLVLLTYSFCSEEETIRTLASFIKPPLLRAVQYQRLVYILYIIFQVEITKISCYFVGTGLTSVQQCFWLW